MEVKFPNNPSGKGYVDYVLWGDNGQPLAVVEAKKPNKSDQGGREQARLYADVLEQMGYVRHVIFYTNGYETSIWDNLTLIYLLRIALIKSRRPISRSSAARR